MCSTILIFVSHFISYKKKNKNLKFFCLLALIIKIGKKKNRVNRHNVAKNLSKDSPSYKSVSHMLIRESDESSLANSEANSHNLKFSCDVGTIYNSPKVSSSLYLGCFNIQ